jgi:hypothetical protein
MTWNMTCDERKTIAGVKDAGAQDISRRMR